MGPEWQHVEWKTTENFGMEEVQENMAPIGLNSQPVPTLRYIFTVECITLSHQGKGSKICHGNILIYRSDWSILIDWELCGPRRPTHTGLWAPYPGSEQLFKASLVYFRIILKKSLSVKNRELHDHVQKERRKGENFNCLEKQTNIKAGLIISCKRKQVARIREETLEKQLLASPSWQFLDSFLHLMERGKKWQYLRASGLFAMAKVSCHPRNTQFFSRRKFKKKIKEGGSDLGDKQS